jgi:predicted component of type VI protein secretion system
MSEETRLRKLIEHWAEHNDEHRARFEEAAEEASSMGLDAMAQNLREAAEKAAGVSVLLRKALETFR